MNSHSSPLRVLVVDDEPLFCWSLSETLRACGDLVTEAGSGAEAVSALSEAREPVDVVLLDYQLPDVRNLSLLAAVRRLSPTSKVIMMSAEGTAEMASDALALGAARVIAKPIDMFDVEALVHATGQPAH